MQEITGKQHCTKKTTFFQLQKRFIQSQVSLILQAVTFNICIFHHRKSLKASLVFHVSIVLA